MAQSNNEKKNTGNGAGAVRNQENHDLLSARDFLLYVIMGPRRERQHYPDNHSGWCVKNNLETIYDMKVASDMMCTSKGSTKMDDREKLI